MAVKLTILGGTDWIDGNVLYAADQIDTFKAVDGALGEVKMFALSMTGAVTKAALQTRNWAICDGTTPASQGISSPTIETTPDLQQLFLRMSNDETSGGTGGEDTHTLTVAEMPSHTHTVGVGSSTGSQSLAARGQNAATTFNSGSTGSGDAHNNVPAYYEVVYFMKVKI